MLSVRLKPQKRTSVPEKEFEVGMLLRSSALEFGLIIPHPRGTTSLVNDYAEDMLKRAAMRSVLDVNSFISYPLVMSKIHTSCPSISNWLSEKRPEGQ